MGELRLQSSSLSFAERSLSRLDSGPAHVLDFSWARSPLILSACAPSQAEEKAQDNILLEPLAPVPLAQAQYSALSLTFYKFFPAKSTILHNTMHLHTLI